MKLPKIIIKLVPDRVCTRCCQHGYVGEKCGLCLGCLNIPLLIYTRLKREEAKRKDTERERFIEIIELAKESGLLRKDPI